MARSYDQIKTGKADKKRRRGPNKRENFPKYTQTETREKIPKKMRQMQNGYITRAGVQQKDKFAKKIQPPQSLCYMLQDENKQRPRNKTQDGGKHFRLTHRGK